MKVISFDVGIKNLAVCIIEINNDNQYSILYWDILNLTKEYKYPDCCYDNCKVKVKYTSNNKYYCGRHAKKENLNLLPDYLKETKIKKYKHGELCEILKTFDIQIEGLKTKKYLIEILNEYCNKKFVQNLAKQPKASEIDLIDIGREMKIKFNIFSTFGNIDYVIIENQISPIANRMKTIQGMIAYHFILQGVNNIHFVSSSNKLNLFSDEKLNSYDKRKKASIVICRKILEDNKNFTTYKDYFEKKGKKDDLADCFLQLLWFLVKNNKIKL